MPISFHRLAQVSAIICIGLAVVWIGAPQWLLTLWGMDSPAPAVMVARRGGALFLGLATMLFMLRHAGKSRERDAVSLGMAVACTALAALGLHEWISLRAGNAIWLAILTEIPLAAAFFRAVYAD